MATSSRDARLVAATVVATSAVWAVHAAWARRRAQKPPPAATTSGVGVPLPSSTSCVYLDWNATSPIFPEVGSSQEDMYGVARQDCLPFTT